jgi:hypothetical protein
MKIRPAFLLLLSAFPVILHANKVYQTLYINRGVLTTIKGTTFPFLAFNSSPTFTAQNVTVFCVKGDSVILNVINNDSISHGFKIKNMPGISYTLAPTANITCTLVTSTLAAYIFYDHLAYPRNTYMGLAGMIVARNKANDKSYVWNLKEHQSTFNSQLAYNVNWGAYYPDYFTINGKSFASLQTDPLVKIQANVKDTLYIFISNTGQSMHALHFHGFHETAMYADARLIKAGWEKDTWGLFSLDAVVLKLIPDKTGKYSVHDHNLVAVTGGNTHPNGMFTIMEVQ